MRERFNKETIQKKRELAVQKKRTRIAEMIALASVLVGVGAWLLPDPLHPETLVPTNGGPTPGETTPGETAQADLGPTSITYQAITEIPQMTQTLDPEAGPTWSAPKEVTGDGYIGPLSDFVYPGEGSFLYANSASLHEGHGTKTNETITYDIGVNNGQLAILAGSSIELLGQTFNNQEFNGCAGPIILAPGYYKNIKITSGGWTIYDLPKENPTEWAKKLGKSEAEQKNLRFGCPLKNLDQIPVFGNK